jgi:predicted alpha/beta hydrolase family esterase
MTHPSPSFLFLHGWHNRRPLGHWQREAVADLEARGHRVEYPQLPNTDEPTVAAWRSAAESSLAALAGGPVVVICHSLSCLLWLGARPTGSGVERVLLVAPPDPRVLATSAVGEFAALPLVVTPDDANHLTIVSSDNDEFAPDGVEAALGHLGIPIRILPGQGHINTDAGYGAWPSLEEWCLDPTTQLVARTADAGHTAP